MSSAHIVFGHFAFFEQYFPRIFWMPFFEKTHCKVVAQADKKGYDYFSDGINLRMMSARPICRALFNLRCPEQEII